MISSLKITEVTIASSLVRTYQAAIRILGLMLKLQGLFKQISGLDLQSIRALVNNDLCSRVSLKVGKFVHR